MSQTAVSTEDKAAAAQVLQEMRQVYLADWKARMQGFGCALTPQDEEWLAAMVPCIIQQAMDSWLRGYLRGNADAAQLVKAIASPGTRGYLVAEELPRFGRETVTDYCELLGVAYPEGENSPFG